MNDPHAIQVPFEFPPDCNDRFVFDCPDFTTEVAVQPPSGIATRTRRKLRIRTPDYYKNFSESLDWVGYIIMGLRQQYDPSMQDEDYDQ